eukprot:m.8270 g.8270  ORF g.8270 m.8270 type:complete len:291 (+) comp6179_c0_seq1:270-1142(+)
MAQAQSRKDGGVDDDANVITDQPAAPDSGDEESKRFASRDELLQMVEAAMTINKVSQRIWIYFKPLDDETVCIPINSYRFWLCQPFGSVWCNMFTKIGQIQRGQATYCSKLCLCQYCINSITVGIMVGLASMMCLPVSVLRCFNRVVCAGLCSDGYKEWKSGRQYSMRFLGQHMTSRSAPGNQVEITTSTLKFEAEQTVFLTADERWNVQRSIDLLLWQDATGKMNEASQQLRDGLADFFHQKGFTFTSQKHHLESTLVYNDNPKKFEDVSFLSTIVGSDHFYYEDRKCF